MQARIAHDQYFSPPAVAQACVRAIPRECAPSRIVEPSVGAAAFVHAARERWPSAIIGGIDIDPGVPGLMACDWSRVGDWPTIAREGIATELVLGNPPFAHAEEHVRAALDVVMPGGRVAFLLRLAFLEGQKRAAFWRVFGPESVHVLVKRPSFTGGGTDSAAYGFFIWRRGFLGAPTMGWI